MARFKTAVGLGAICRHYVVSRLVTIGTRLCVLFFPPYVWETELRRGDVYIPKSIQLSGVPRTILRPGLRNPVFRRR